MIPLARCNPRHSFRPWLAEDKLFHPLGQDWVKSIASSCHSATASKTMLSEVSEASKMGVVFGGVLVACCRR